MSKKIAATELEAIVPWVASDATKHIKKADTPKAKRQWRDVANSALKSTGDDGAAVREANAAVGKRKSWIAKAAG